MNFYLPYLKKYRLPFFIAVLCVALEACCDLLGPALMARIINRGIEQSSRTEILYWGSLMLGVTAFGACFAVARNILASRVSQRFGADVRRAVFSKILRFSETSADKIEPGSLITRMTNDTTQVMQFVNGIMRIFIKAPVTCLGSIIMASLLNIRLAFIIYALVALISLCIVFVMKLSYPRFAMLQSAMDRVNSVSQEYLLGVRLVKAFGTHKTEETRFKKTNEDVCAAGISSQMPVTLLSPFMTLLVGIAVLFTLFCGGRLFVAGRALPGDISAFIIYTLQILSSLVMMTNIFTVFVRTRASSARLGEIFESAEDASCSGRTGSASFRGAGPEGSVEFRNVTFAYPAGSGLPAVRNLSFTVDAGQTLAVIGPTGSGKSTLVWLLLRFYEPDSGKILLGGTDISVLDAAELRRMVALAPQKVFLSAGTVEENLRWGNPDSDEEGLYAALDGAQAGFVRLMDKGVRGRIESSGVNLSGGQKQRIALARALVKKAPVLILDDATSALDAITESGVLSFLRSDRGKRQTLVVITQRCGTAMGADRILVLENGAAAGFGTHESLMEACETYRLMYRSQIGGNSSEEQFTGSPQSKELSDARSE